VRNKAHPAFGAGRGWATRPSGSRWVSLPGPANHPKPNPYRFLCFRFGLGGGLGLRWGVVRVTRVSPVRAATGLPRMKPAGARWVGGPVWASKLKTKVWGSYAHQPRPRWWVWGPTLKPQHPGAGVQARWGLMHLMLQWVSHHEPANPQPWGG